jgi:cell division protein ZapA
MWGRGEGLASVRCPDLMARRSVDVRIGGQSYRVVSSASDEELHRLAARVDQKLNELVPVGKPIPPQALALAAIALAHDLESERARRIALERKSRDMLRRVLVRVESALDTDAGETGARG